jgi:hypothetical protein
MSMYTLLYSTANSNMVFLTAAGIPQLRQPQQLATASCPFSYVETACVGACEGVPACVPALALLGIEYQLGAERCIKDDILWRAFDGLEPWSSSPTSWQFESEMSQLSLFLRDTVTRLRMAIIGTQKKQIRRIWCFRSTFLTIFNVFLCPNYTKNLFWRFLIWQ